jgi:hypothetical protein
MVAIEVHHVQAQIVLVIIHHIQRQQVVHMIDHVQEQLTLALAFMNQRAVIISNGKWLF